MEVISLVGSSGTGKSYRALIIAKEKEDYRRCICEAGVYKDSCCTKGFVYGSFPSGSGSRSYKTA